MAEKNETNSSKKERRGQKEVAVECLQDALNKVFKSFNTEDYLTVIADSLKVSTANISKKTIKEMNMQELISAKKALLSEVSAIDKQIELLASGAPASASAKDAAKAEKKEEVKDAVKEETKKEEEKK